MADESLQIQPWPSAELDPSAAASGNGAAGGDQAADWQGGRPHAGVETTPVMWIVLGGLFGAGGLIAITSLLLPHPRAFDDSALWIDAALAFGVGAVCVLGASRLPAWAIHPATFAGTLAISAAIYFGSNDAAVGYYAVIYVWVGLYASFFFSRVGAIAHMALAGIAYAVVLGQISDTGELTQWLTTMATLAVAAVFVDSLVRRVRRIAGESQHLAADRALLLAQVGELARTDDLTGLPNRRAWNEALDREIARAERNDTPLCVAVIDLDHFKEYNDVHGHQAGDRLLRDVAARWRMRLRTTDVLARFGGEEFTVALPDCPLPDATALMERLREGTPENETCSVGLVRWDGRESAEQMLGRADAAMYAAKAAGRDRVVVAWAGRLLD